MGLESVKSWLLLMQSPAVMSWINVMVHFEARVHPLPMLKWLPFLSRLSHSSHFLSRQQGQHRNEGMDYDERKANLLLLCPLTPAGSNATERLRSLLMINTVSETR